MLNIKYLSVLPNNHLGQLIVNILAGVLCSILIAIMIYVENTEKMLKERENSLSENKISDSWEDKVSKGNSLTLGDD